jgi:ATP dependent DNA ligase C terminal region
VKKVRRFFARCLSLPRKFASLRKHTLTNGIVDKRGSLGRHRFRVPEKDEVRCQRSPDWLKIKSRPQQEFVVCGFTEGKGSRSKFFGALLLGAYRNGKLRYFGHSGTGFSEKGMKETMQLLNRFLPISQQSRIRPRSPRKSSGFGQSWCAK